jgi:hypothetical protein
MEDSPIPSWITLRRAIVPTREERILHEFRRKDLENLVSNWQDEASRIAIDGNPKRTHYLETNWVWPWLNILFPEGMG